MSEWGARNSKNAERLLLGETGVQMRQSERTGQERNGRREKKTKTEREEEGRREERGGAAFSPSQKTLLFFVGPANYRKVERMSTHASGWKIQTNERSFCVRKKTMMFACFYCA